MQSIFEVFATQPEQKKTRLSPKGGFERGLILIGIAAWMSTYPHAWAQEIQLKTIDVKDIKPGMRGYGMTVFKGTEPERFDVEVIDVLHNFRPDQDLILIRTPHPVLNQAIAVAGMSGSPIYLDNKLAGAYAYGWTFGKEPVVGVTPIKNMLREMQRPLRKDPKLGPYKVNGTSAFSGFERMRPTPPSGLEQTTPLFLGGFSDNIVALLNKTLTPFGFTTLIATGSAERKSFPLDQPGGVAFKPGSAMAVQLVRGDINAHAIGTVTALDHGKAVAFGHPMMNAGQTLLPTARAKVVHVLSSYQRSFKMAEPLQPLGALVQDRPTTVVVDTRITAPTIPLTIRLKGGPAHLRSVWHAELADHFAFTPMLTFSALANALESVAGDMTDVMLRLRTELKVEGFNVLKLDEQAYLPMGLGNPMELARMRIFPAIDAAYNTPFGKVPIQSIVVDVDISLKKDTLDLVDSGVVSDAVNPGEPVYINMVLRARDGSESRRRISFVPPAELKGSELEFAIEPNHEVTQVEPEPRDLAGIYRILQTRFTERGWVVTMSMPSKGVRFRGRLVENLPASALDTFSSSHAADHSQAYQMVQRITVPTTEFPRGTARLKVKIREFGQHE